MEATGVNPTRVQSTRVLEYESVSVRISEPADIGKSHASRNCGNFLRLRVIVKKVTDDTACRAVAPPPRLFSCLCARSLARRNLLRAGDGIRPHCHDDHLAPFAQPLARGDTFSRSNSKAPGGVGWNPR